MAPVQDAIGVFVCTAHWLRSLEWLLRCHRIVVKDVWVLSYRVLQRWLLACFQEDAWFYHDATVDALETAVFLDSSDSAAQRALAVRDFFQLSLWYFWHFLYEDLRVFWTVSGQIGATHRALFDRKLRINSFVVYNLLLDFFVLCLCKNLSQYFFLD